MISSPSHSATHPKGGAGIPVFWGTARQASVVSPGAVGPTHHQVLARPSRRTALLWWDTGLPKEVAGGWREATRHVEDQTWHLQSRIWSLNLSSHYCFVRSFGYIECNQQTAVQCSWSKSQFTSLPIVHPILLVPVDDVVVQWCKICHQPHFKSVQLCYFLSICQAYIFINVLYT